MYIDIKQEKKKKKKKKKKKTPRANGEEENLRTSDQAIDESKDRAKTLKEKLF